MEDEVAQPNNIIQFQPMSSAAAHLACRKCGTIAEVKCDCGVDYIYVRAAERAEKAIMENPEMSNRALAAKAGVAPNTIRNMRKAGGQKCPPEKRIGRDGKKHPAKRTSVPSTALPNGYKMLSEAILAGIEIERSGGGFQEAIVKSGMAATAYSRGRDVVLLAERTDLSAKDTEIIQCALKQMDENRIITYAHDAIRPIADRVWGRKGHRLKSDKKRLEAFSSAMSYLLTVCTSASKITIPYLPEAQCASALDSIKEAKQALDVLQRRIRKGDGEYHE